MPIFLLSVFLLSSVLTPTIQQDNKSAGNGRKISIPTSTAKATEVPIPGIDAESIYVGDANTQQSVMTYKSGETWSIASLTKVMTAAVYLDQNPDLNKVITLEKEDMVGGSSLKVPVGTKFTALDMLHASLMSSANNATYALARAGTNLSFDEFMSAMNEKAKGLGLSQTTFTEPTGLDPENRSTPQEYSKIFDKALEYELIRNIMATTSYTLDPINHGAFPIGNSNRLLQQETGFEVVGGKTGFTDGSDFNFATQVKKGDKEITVVVFGDKTYDQAFKSAKKLADQTLSTASASTEQLEKVKSAK